MTPLELQPAAPNGLTTDASALINGPPDSQPKRQWLIGDAVLDQSR